MRGAERFVVVRQCAFFPPVDSGVVTVSAQQLIDDSGECSHALYLVLTSAILGIKGSSSHACALWSTIDAATEEDDENRARSWRFWRVACVRAPRDRAKPECR